MALKGNLRDFSTTQLLNLIHLAGKTGTLTIEGPSEVARMSFKGGRLIYAQLGSGNGHLTTLLRRTNKLTDEQVKILRARVDHNNDKELGLLLINAGYVTQTDILQTIRQHVLDVVYRLFTWVEGGFRFDPEVLPPDEKITVPIDLENVIMEGSRRLREWEQLSEEIPNLDMALKFTDRPSAKMRNMNLTVEEGRVVSFINPKNPLRQIAQANKLSDLDVRRIVYGLLQAGLVELVRPEGMPLPAPTTGGHRATPVQAPGDKTQQKSLVSRLINRIRSL